MKDIMNIIFGCTILTAFGAYVCISMTGGW